MHAYQNLNVQCVLKGCKQQCNIILIFWKQHVHWTFTISQCSTEAARLQERDFAYARNIIDEQNATMSRTRRVKWIIGIHFYYGNSPLLPKLSSSPRSVRV